MCNIVYKMKIGIIGNGFVGRATQIFAKNYDALYEFTPIIVYIYDIRPEACQPPGITLEELDRECDILFFCLPTPLQHDGSCYTQILEDTIAKCPSNPYKVIRARSLSDSRRNTDAILCRSFLPRQTGKTISGGRKNGWSGFRWLRRQSKCM